MPRPWLGHRKWDRPRSSHHSEVWVLQFQSEHSTTSGSVCFLHGRAELLEGNPAPTVHHEAHHWSGSSSLAAGAGRAALATAFLSRSDFYGRVKVLFLDPAIILWLWRFLYYSGWFLTPFLLCTKVQAPDPCWLLGGTPHKPD